MISIKNINTTKFNYYTSIKLQKQIKTIIKQQPSNYKFINLDFQPNQININFLKTNLNKSKITLHSISLENQIYSYQFLYNIKKLFIIDFIQHFDFTQTFKLSTKLPYHYFNDLQTKQDFQSNQKFNYNPFIHNPSFLK